MYTFKNLPWTNDLILSRHLQALMLYSPHDQWVLRARLSTEPYWLTRGSHCNPTIFSFGFALATLSLLNSTLIFWIDVFIPFIRSFLCSWGTFLLSLSCLNLSVILPLNSLSGSSSELLSLGIMTLEASRFEEDTLHFFLCAGHVSALTLLHLKSVYRDFLSFLLFYLTSFLYPFSFQVNLLCMETVAVFRKDSDPAAYSHSRWCVLQVPMYLDRLPQGQVWSTSHLWFLLWVSMFPTLVHRWPALCSYRPCCVLWAFVWSRTLGPLHSSGTFYHFYLHVMHPTPEVQPSQHIYCFSPHFNLGHFLRDIPKHWLRFMGKNCEAKYLLAYFEIELESLNPALQDWTDSGAAMALPRYVEVD